MSLRGQLAKMGIYVTFGGITNFPGGIAVDGDTISTGQGVAVTDAGDTVDVTFTANAPTPALTQTIADGTVPTVAELGQWVANQEAVTADIQAQLNALLASLRTVGTIDT